MWSRGSDHGTVACAELVEPCPPIGPDCARLGAKFQCRVPETSRITPHHPCVLAAETRETTGHSDPYEHHNVN